MASLIGRKISNLFNIAKLMPQSQCCYSVVNKERTWNVLRVNHLAIASENMEKNIQLYRDVLGIKTSETIPLPEHGVSTVFVELSNMKLELLIPFGSRSPIGNFLQKNPSGGMHHICLEVDNIKNAVKDLKEKKIRMLNEEPKIGAHGKPVVFLHPKDCGGVLIELEEV
ncbi:Methylmalonyl-CoA epimerase, mitochondrial, partial [Stegodyphus mimosarum]